MLGKAVRLVPHGLGELQPRVLPSQLDGGLTLLEPTSAHVRNTEVVCEQAIDLFDEFVRKSGPAADNADAISAVFRSVLPQVTKVVALHFQRTLVNRALGRLEAGEADPALEAALAAADAGRLEVEWR